MPASTTWRRHGKLLVPVASRLSVSTVEAVLRAALRHVGIARLLHYQVADAVKAGKLQIILEPFEPMPAPVSLIHAARGQMPLKMRRFLDFSLPRLRGVFATLEKKGTTRRR
jgi:DNA-binding transcriptional LysR family regulator